MRCHRGHQEMASGPSPDFDKVFVWQRSAGKLHEPAAERERTKIYSGKADTVDERPNLYLRVSSSPA